MFAGNEPLDSFESSRVDYESLLAPDSGSQNFLNSANGNKYWARLTFIIFRIYSEFSVFIQNFLNLFVLLASQYLKTNGSPANSSGQDSRTLKSQSLQLSNELRASSDSKLSLSYTHQALTTLGSHMILLEFGVFESF